MSWVFSRHPFYLLAINCLLRLAREFGVPFCGITTTHQAAEFYADDQGVRVFSGYDVFPKACLT